MTDDRRWLAIGPWTWILGFQMLLVLPFVGQPLHMDDPIYLDIGRNVLETPWHPHDFPYCFEGACVPDMASHSHPPLVGYWIGFLLRVFGEGAALNVTLHLGFVVFPLIFAAGMYSLAVRFTALPLIAAAIAVASPAATVMSHNLMADYPTLAFWTAALALYVGGIDSGRPSRVWASGAFLTLAAFSSYPALMAAGLCMVYALLARSRMRAAYLAPLGAVAFVAGWLTYSSVYFQRFVLGATAEYFLDRQGSLQAETLIYKGLGLAILLVPTLVFPVPLLRSGIASLGGRPAILWTMAAAALAQLAAPEFSLPGRLLAASCLTLGGWTALGIASKLRRGVERGPGTLPAQRDGIFLATWFAGVVLAAMAVYPVAASRYVLPLAPAAVLLAFSGASPRALGSLRGDGAASLAVSLVLGVTLSVADFEAARISRDIAGHIGTTLEGWEEQTRFGGEWGFRHYMEAEGFRQFISTSDDVFGGQFVVTPMEAVPYAVGQDVASMLVPVGQRSWLPRIPILLMNRAAHAGFYSSGWGLLPFAFSHDRAEGVDVRQVNYLVERLPEITIEALDPVGEMIPRPAPAGIGGVELVVPPGTVRIPYEGPVPASVSFSCVLPEGNLGPCPIAVYHQVNQTRRELPLEQSRSIDESEGIDVSFEVNATTAGSIILEVNQVNTPQPGEVTIRNWRISPPGGAL